ncbi:uncharacterized protein LOC131680310 [Topomyia yanbarensis]|uniref:uncharacterized protein LOC131680310 n=1 Tax=Topomyia yanbarensis TaxID=2498891 RepID=UPI00273C8D74|nr:uncharacterized protein LOC131680310 [Topomyia yanbarensis]
MKFGTEARRVKSKFISVFARFGLPDVIVTDGGPPFNSKELIDFFQKHSIQVMKSPPYNPSSNGQAERMVSVGGRVYLAHRNQLKLFGTRKKSRALIFASSPTRKRRGEDDQEEDIDDEASDFYGFAADSFIYRGSPNDQPMVCDSDDGDSERNSLPPGNRVVDPQEGTSALQWPQSNSTNPSASLSREPICLRRSNRMKRRLQDPDFVCYNKKRKD